MAVPGKSVPGRGNTQCKGHGAGMCMTLKRGPVCLQGSESGGESGREASRGGTAKGLWVTASGSYSKGNRSHSWVVHAEEGHDPARISEGPSGCWVKMVRRPKQELGDQTGGRQVPPLDQMLMTQG